MKGLLLTVLQLSQQNLLTYLIAYLNKNGIKTKSNGKWIYHRGTYPVMLVAHLDTVHRVLPTEDTIFYSKDGNILNCVNGIGGDDRCGVVIILELLKRTKLDFSILFTTDEEIGALGASDFVKTHKGLKNVNAIIEYDRRGNSDIVRYYDANLQLTEIAEKYGFVRNTGSFSDIVELSEAYGISSINISSGYHNEHSHYETINLVDMENIIVKSVEMFKNEQFKDKIVYEDSFISGSYLSSIYSRSTSGKVVGKTSKYDGTIISVPKTTTYNHPTKRCDYCDSPKDTHYYSGYGCLCIDCAEELGLLDEEDNYLFQYYGY